MPSIISVSAILFALVSFQAYALPYDNALVNRNAGDIGHSLLIRTGKTVGAACRARKPKAAGKKPSKGTGKRDEAIPIAVGKRAPITLWHVTSNADADSVMQGVKLGSNVGDFTPKGKPGFYTTDSMENAIVFCSSVGRGCEAAIEFHYNPNTSGLKVVPFDKKATETVEQWMERDDAAPTPLGFWNYCNFVGWCAGGTSDPFPSELAGTGLDTADVIIGPISEHDHTQYVFRSPLALEALGKPVKKHPVTAPK